MDYRSRYVMSIFVRLIPLLTSVTIKKVNKAFDSLGASYIYQSFVSNTLRSGHQRSGLVAFRNNADSAIGFALSTSINISRHILISTKIALATTILLFLSNGTYGQSYNPAHFEVILNSLKSGINIKNEAEESASLLSIYSNNNQSLLLGMTNSANSIYGKANDAFLINKANTDLLFFTGNKEHLRIQPGGIFNLTGDVETSINFYRSGLADRLSEINLIPTGHLNIGHTSANGNANIYFSTRGYRRMTIDDSGDVGIGTEHPQSKLFVDGGKIGISKNGIDWYQWVDEDGEFNLETPLDDVVVKVGQESGLRVTGSRNLTIEHGRLRFDTYRYTVIDGFGAGNGLHNWEIYPRIDNGPDACYEPPEGLPPALEAPVHDLFFNVADNEVSKICQATGAYVVLSDRRVKKNIEPIGAVTEKIMRLNPVSYNYNSDRYERHKSYGFIAQEVQRDFPDIVENFGEKIGLNYDEFAAISIKAIQEQNTVISELQTEISELKKEFEKLKSEIRNNGVKNNF